MLLFRSTGSLALGSNSRSPRSSGCGRVSHLRRPSRPPTHLSCHAQIDPVDHGSSSTDDREDELAAMVRGIMDTNQLQTRLAAAIAAEDYVLATAIRDRLEEITGGRAARIDWEALEVPFWLSDRLDRLGFKFPTEVQRRAAAVLMAGMDATIQSETGSGKTFSFLVPTLARLVYPPDVFPEDLRGPQAIIVVPTMELGVQVCLLAYRLLGGSVSHGQPGDRANMFSFLGPKGILVRGLLNKEEIVMAKTTDYLAATHLVVATPEALVQVYTGDDRKPILDYLRVLCFDEFDECIQKRPEATMMALSSVRMNSLFGEKPQVILVGATLKDDQISLASTAGWINDHVSIRVGKEDNVPSSLRHRFVVCDPSRRLATLVRMLRQDLEEGKQEGSRTRVIVFAESPEEAARCVEPLRSALWTEHGVSLLLPPGSPPPTPLPGSLAAEELEDKVPRCNPTDPETAADASHELAGSSPFSATDTIHALLSFRDHKTSLLLCTGQAARGLDLPAVSHVFNLGCPPDAAQYLHRAGRTGRIGATIGGTVTTIIGPDELPSLMSIMDSLNISPTKQDDSGLGAPLLSTPSGDGEEETGSAESVDKQRKGLEDIFNLL